MKEDLKKLYVLSKEELNNRIGKTGYERFINLLKIILLVFCTWFIMKHLMGNTELINSYPFILWVISGIVPAIYFADVLFGSLKYDGKLPFEVINISSFMLFIILTFIEMVVFRIFGFGIDIYYLQIPVFLIFSFIFMELVSIIIINLNKLSKKIGMLINVFVLPVICFSGVFFRISDVGSGKLRSLLRIDPFYYLIKGFRNSFVGKVWFFHEPKQFAYFAVECLILIIVCFVINMISKKKK